MESESYQLRSGHSSSSSPLRSLRVGRRSVDRYSQKKLRFSVVAPIFCTLLQYAPRCCLHLSLIASVHRYKAEAAAPARAPPFQNAALFCLAPQAASGDNSRPGAIVVETSRGGRVLQFVSQPQTQTTRPLSRPPPLSTDAFPSRGHRHRRRLDAMPICLCAMFHSQIYGGHSRQPGQMMRRR